MHPEQILSDLIRIDTSNPPGNETGAARYLQELCGRHGVASEIIEPEPGRGSFIARIGRGSKKLLFISHLDVVPAGDGWDFDPFSGEVRDGIVYGRGALDCKDLTAAQVAAALELHASGALRGGELILCATADEEKGGCLGAKHICEQHPEKIRADFAINEGAEQPVMVNGRLVCFFQVGEKGTAWSRLTTTGRSCHGSLPGLGENAVVKAARAVAALEKYSPEIKLIPAVRHLIAELSRLKGLEADISKNGLDDIIGRLGLGPSLTETLRASTRMTVSPNLIQGGTKTNIVPDLCQVELDIRILPGQDMDYVTGELRRCVGEDLALEPTQYNTPTFSTADSPFYRLLEEAGAALMGKEALFLPHISTGSTDSKYLRGLGIPAYGIAPMAPGFDPELRSTIHGRNERIDLASLRLKTRFLVEVAQRYLG